MREGAQVHRG